MMTLIRRGIVADKSSILALLELVWEDDYVQHCWDDWVSHPEQGITLVAESDDQIVGLCYLKKLSATDWWFQAMRVHPNYRRHGIGSLLTNRSLEESRNHGGSTALLGIDEDNEASLRMTAKAGFEPILSYKRLIGQVNAQAKSAHNWWQAGPEYIQSVFDLLQQYHQGKDLPPSLFGCWQWQPLTTTAVAQAIKDGQIWCWSTGADRIAVVACIEHFTDEFHLFAPCGNEEYLPMAVTDAFHCAQELGAKQVELWLHDDQTVMSYLHNQGFDAKPSDGYIIWGRQL